MFGRGVLCFLLMSAFWLSRTLGSTLCAAMSLGVGFASPAAASQSSVDAIRAAWPEHHVSTALSIARRESRLQPGVRGCGGTCYGLFQIVFPVHRHWLASIGVTSPSQLLDPVVNAKAAYHLFKITGSNWSPWCHSSGYPRSC